jgi:Ca-activated chloride channel family protein
MSFTWPWMLLGLVLVPVLVGLYLLAQRRRSKYAVRFTNLELLQSVAGPGPGWRRHVPPALFLAGSTLLLISLARPMAVISTPREQAAIVLVVDVSGSMKADDVTPTRMVAAQRAALAFLDSVPAETQVGLVTFHNTAQVNVPLTRDHMLVRQGVEALVSGGATDLGDGLAIALEQLAQRPADKQGKRGPGLIVLLSDGEANRGMPALDAARLASDQAVGVYTVGIGERGVVTRIQGGGPTHLDEATLMAIAEQTGGDYYYAAGARELSDIYTHLGSQLAWVKETTEVTAVVGAAAMVFFAAGSLLGLHWFQRFP